MPRINLLGDPAFRSASYARTGGHVAVTTDPHQAVGVMTDPLGCDEVLRTPCVARAGKTMLRSFLVDGPQRILQHELLYTMGFGPFVYRHNMTTNKSQPVLQTEVREVTCLAESADGRYIAVGGSTGRIEIWNLDQHQPRLVYRSPQCDKGRVEALCFNRSNVEMFASFSDGELQLIEPLKGDAQTMESARRWAVYTVACCTHTKGVAFGGDGKRVWFLDVSCQTDKNYIHTSPFRLDPRKTYSGSRFMVVGAIPNARLSHLDTDVGPMIHHLRFVSDTELLVVGDTNAQLWDLADQTVIDEVRYDECALVGAGIHGNDCHIAVRS